MKLQSQKVNSLDSSNVVFPIGKLKGRNLYELMENEPERLKWFVNQQFFKEKYSNIYNIIVNGSNDIKDSKEHNEIVQMFYDNDFLIKFFMYKRGYVNELSLFDAYINLYTKTLKKELQSFVDKYKELYKHYIYALDFCNELNGLYSKNKIFIDNNNNYSKKGMYANLLDTKDFLKEIKANLDICKKKLYELKDKLKLIPELEPEIRYKTKLIRSEHEMNDIVIDRFEFDINFRYDGNYITGYTPHTDYDRIEIKPIVGEDYPDVLRQCKRQKTNILIIKDFVCESTTLDTLKEMFSPIKIIILKDVVDIDIEFE